MTSGRSWRVARINVFRAPSTTISDAVTVALIAARITAAASASTKRRPKPPNVSFNHIMQTPEEAVRALVKAAKAIPEWLRRSQPQAQSRRQKRMLKHFERTAACSPPLLRSQCLRQAQCTVVSRNRAELWMEKSQRPAKFQVRANVPGPTGSADRPPRPPRVQAGEG